MPKERTSKEAYKACAEEGSFIPLAKADKYQAKTMMKVALMDFASCKEWLKKAPQEGGQWNLLYKIHYDILHQLIEAFLLLDKMKIRTHECLFAYVCENYQEFELDWNFFEMIRTKRNRSLYYGEPIIYADWKKIELQINLYIKMFKRSIEDKISSLANNG